MLIPLDNLVGYHSGMYLTLILLIYNSAGTYLLLPASFCRVNMVRAQSL